MARRASSGTEAAGHRARLMDGMAAAVAAKGYAETTIADVARHARVSKRTFYEHFVGKEECLLALYVAASDAVIAAVRDAVRSARGADARIAAGARVYLARLVEHPQLVRTLFIEILAAGPAGLAVRAAVNDRFARLVRSLARGGATRPSPRLALAVVGGINELVLQAVLDDRLDRLPRLERPIVELLTTVLER